MGCKPKLIPPLTQKQITNFWIKVDKHTSKKGCWLWLASKNPGGYGTFRVNERWCKAHRVSYYLAYGNPDLSLVLDHYICQNRACVRPTHLEEVTEPENTRRGNSGINNRSKTHCPKGHPYDIKTKSGRRKCSICVNAQKRKARLDKKQKSNNTKLS